jgi:hypothetical protein
LDQRVASRAKATSATEAIRESLVRVLGMMRFSRPR